MEKMMTWQQNDYLLFNSHIYIDNIFNNKTNMLQLKRNIKVIFTISGVEAHHRVNSPDTGRNSRGRHTINKKFI